MFQHRTHLPPRNGFTLVEVLIAVTVLSILATIAVGHVRSTRKGANEAALQANLTTIRKAFQQYEAEHDDTYPVVFPSQLLITTNKSGLPGSGYGPYLRDGFPMNPINGQDTVKVVNVLLETADGSTGWIYSLEEGEFRANLVKQASEGSSYYEW